ncbi:hypothetical protein FACS189473_1620 [Spirochaetia bacterium]|nr:hypothetical protein FACS189473_1620 [Spirochaetia bacterium]
MDYRKIIQENYMQLVFVFFVFLFMVLFNCLFTSARVNQYLTMSAEEVLATSEEKIMSKFREAQVSLVNASILVINRLEAGYDAGEIEDYLAALAGGLRSNPEFLLGFRDLTGIIGEQFVSGSRWRPPQDYVARKRPWYTAARSDPGKAVFTMPYSYVHNGGFVISVSMVLLGSKGEDYGVLALDMEMDDLAQDIAALSLARGGYGVLLSPDMAIIAHEDASKIGMRMADMGPDFEALASQFQAAEGSVSVEAKIDGKNVRINFFRKMSNGWYVGLVIPRSSYYRDVYIMALILALMGAIMMIVLSSFLIRLSMEKLRSDDENRAKSSFLARVSHEIRTPMNSILGMSEIIMRKNISAEVYEYISIIRQSGNTLLSIINDILDFSKIESGKVEIESKPYNMASLINDVVNVIRMRLTDKPIDFFVSLDSGIPAELVGDEVRIRQVLINLLNNAVKYTRQGYIALDVRMERLSDSKGGGTPAIRLVMRVEDSGIGIKKTDIEQLFHDFTRVDLNVNQGIEGSGLGLAIAHTLCKAMKGDITVDSTYGKGSVFTAHVIQSFGDGRKVARIEAPETKRVLLFEERPAYAKSFLEAMDTIGAAVTCAESIDAFLNGLESGHAETPYAYAFVSSRYAENCIPFWKDSGSAVKLIIMLEVGDVSICRDAGSVHLPVYSSVLANILNGAVNETSAARQGSSTGGSPLDSRIRFEAPMARTLIVDDIATNLRVAAELMRPYNMTIDTCLSGAEAIEMVRKNHYDLVFMDHMMPEMDGIAATTAIRAIDTLDACYSQLPVIMLTANAVSGQREMFLRNGINDFLAKPIEIQQLNAILEKWIPKEKQTRIAASSGNKQTGAEELPVIAGLNTRSGLSNSGGSPGSYKKILAIFCADADERIPQIRAALETGDLPRYTTLVHALKGASRSIGAEEFGVMAAELEEAGRAGEQTVIRDRTGHLLDRLLMLREAIGAAIEEAPGGEGNTGTADFAALDLPALKAALKSMDSGSVNRHLQEYAAMPLSAGLRKLVNELEQDILLFDYDKAIEEIDTVLYGEVL